MTLKFHYRDRAELFLFQNVEQTFDLFRHFRGKLGSRLIARQDAQIGNVLLGLGRALLCVLTMYFVNGFAGGDFN